MTAAEFEFMAERFRRDTHMMAPGKDAPMSMPAGSDDERRAAWDEWIRGPLGHMARGAFMERPRVLDEAERELLEAEDWGYTGEADIKRVFARLRET